MGDHVFADLAEPARQTGWATGAIVRELEHEIEVLRSPKYIELQRKGEEIDNMLNSALSRSHLEKLDALRRDNFREKGALFNPNFGSIFNSRGDASSFAFNVRRIGTCIAVAWKTSWSTPWTIVFTLTWLSTCRTLRR